MAQATSSHPTAYVSCSWEGPAMYEGAEITCIEFFGQREKLPFDPRTYEASIAQKHFLLNAKLYEPAKTYGKTWIISVEKIEKLEVLLVLKDGKKLKMPVYCNLPTIDLAANYKLEVKNSQGKIKISLTRPAC